MSNVQKRTGAGWSLSLDIDGASVPYQNVLGLTIRESVFDLLPRLQLAIKGLDIFVTSPPVKSGSIVTISAVNDENTQKSTMNMRFVVMSAQADLADPNLKTAAVLQIDAILATDRKMLSLRSETYDMRFSKAVEKVAGECGLDCNVRIQSNDKMLWGCFNQSPLSFLNTAKRSSYIAKDELPVLFCDKNGTLVYDGWKHASKSDTVISFNSDVIGSVTPVGYDLGLTAKGKSVSMMNVPYYDWSYKDMRTYAGEFLGGFGVASTWVNGSGEVEEEKSGDPTSRLVRGVLPAGVHKNYYKAQAQNRRLGSDVFSDCVILTCGLYDVPVLSHVHIDIPEDTNGGKSQSLSGEYLIFQVMQVMNRDAANLLVCASRIK